MSWGKDQRVNNGRHQILDRIGTGGFGVTYRAIDFNAPSPDNIVAIKTVNEKRQRQANFEIADFTEILGISPTGRATFDHTMLAYHVVGYYLRHQDTVEEYLHQREQLAESVQQKLSEIQPDLNSIRSRLLTH